MAALETDDCILILLDGLAQRVFNCGMLLQMLQRGLNEEQVGSVARDDVAFTRSSLLVHQVQVALALEIVVD